MAHVDPDDTRSMRERMEAGDLYLADDPDIEEQGHAARDVMAAYNMTSSRQSTARRDLLVQLVGSVGDDCELRSPVYVDFGTNIHLGDRVFANFGLTALDVATITIGDDVQIGPHVQLLTPTHPVDADLRRAKWEAAEPISIGANVWLGGGVIVCPGVTIGENTVVGAGSVVVKDLPANVVAVGNPARVVRELS